MSVAAADMVTRTGRLGYVPGVLSKADSLLETLDDHPEDVGLHERAARALEAESRAGEAVALLQGKFVHLNAHDPGVLPCLCRRCIVADDLTASADGNTFHRDFAISGAASAKAVAKRPRVLFYWIPENLLDRRQKVRRSVATGLRSRLG